MTAGLVKKLGLKSRFFLLGMGTRS